jgi:hypothetical protein
MSRPPRQDRRLTKVLAALRTHGGPGRSPLYRWMRRHHDTLLAAFAETPPAWAPLAAEMAAVGLTDADGKPPSATSVRQTWYRVRRDLARARERPAMNAPVLAPDEIAPAVHAVASPAPVDDARPAAPMPRPGMTLDIRPARPAASGAPLAGSAADVSGNPRATAAASPPPETPAPNLADASGDEGPAAQLRRLQASMGVRKVPLPKVM